jgi:hypothetical protein
VDVVGADLDEEDVEAGTLSPRTTRVKPGVMALGWVRALWGMLLLVVCASLARAFPRALESS